MAANRNTKTTRNASSGTEQQTVTPGAGAREAAATGPGPVAGEPHPQKTVEDPTLSGPDEPEAPADEAGEDGADVDEEGGEGAAPEIETATMKALRGNHVHAGKRLEKGESFEVNAAEVEFLETRRIAERA